MPGGDRTGPLGAGPMTGRRAGRCVGYNVPGYLNPICGRRVGFGRGGSYGRGLGMGGGRGWRNQAYAIGYSGWGRKHPAVYDEAYDVPSPSVGIPRSHAARNDEVMYLEEQARHLRESLDQIESRIKELHKEPDTTPEKRSNNRGGNDVT